MTKEDIFDVIAAMDTSKMGFIDFVQFEQGFAVLENKIGRFPLFFGNETEITPKSLNTGFSLPSPSHFLYSNSTPKEQPQKKSPRTQMPDPRYYLIFKYSKMKEKL